jgi:hypothetical protein
MIQLVMLTNRKCSWFYLSQKIIEFFDNMQIEIAMRYYNYNEFALHSLFKPWETLHIKLAKPL